MENLKTVVIVGGVAGGASAAARLRRLDEDVEIILFERGEYVSFANCGLPYYVSGDIQDRTKLLLQTPQSLKQRFRLDVRVRHEVLAINREKKSVTVCDLATGAKFDQSYDALVLSPGATPIRPPLPGIDLPGVYSLRTLNDMDVIKAKVDGKHAGRVMVVGAGFIGLEMAEAFRHRGWDVLLVEKLPQVLGPADPEMAVLVAQELKKHGVELALNAALNGIFLDEKGGLSADVGGRLEKVDMVLMAVGVKPEVKLAVDAGLALGARKGIQVDEHMRTQDPAIYAVGDAVEVKHEVMGSMALFPLAGPANRQGRIVADNLAGIASVYRGTQGTAIVRAFEQVFAMTGASERSLKSVGRRYEKVYLLPGCHAGYYPGATTLTIKLLFDPQDGRVLGAQAVGTHGVDKFIDVIATALQANFTVRDLEELESTYAPPFGSAKNPQNFAGFIASNILDSKMGVFHSDEAAKPREDQFLLDVRTPKEFAGGAIPGAVNIPVDDLRARVGELPKDKELLVYCKVGLRGYVASRILSQAGFKNRNLTGGYTMWELWKEANNV